ncbi:AP2 domain-containing protein [Paenibacillus naphthalenovorans]|uniref:AP2 domain-containing protein n=1 Tax=Paenibacillus naphthalenovorans TaxID=162209 RepID=UPI003D273232
MKSIPLSKGKFALVDDEDFDLVSEFTWQAVQIHKVWYAITTVYRDGKSQTLYMHRLIMNPKPGQEVDHKNRNGLDNRRSVNLRIVDHATNQHNQRSKGLSRYKGVNWRKDRGKWRAEIRKGKIRLFLGHFSDEVDAAKAYDAAARELYGEFASTNF